MAETAWGYRPITLDNDKLVDITFCEPRPGEEREALEYAAKHQKAGKVTHVGYWTNVEELGGTVVYLPIDMLRKSIRKQVAQVIANDQERGRTPLLIHYVRDRFYTYGKRDTGENYHQAHGLFAVYQ